VKAHHITSTTAVPVAVSADAARRAVKRLDLGAPAIRALHALGLDSRVTGRPGALQFGLAGSSDGVEVSVTVAIEGKSDDSCVLTITTAFRATDDQARVHLLDAWTIIGPLAGQLARRAARTVRDYAERDEIEAGALRSQLAVAWPGCASRDFDGRDLRRSG
jgi:hypothetical protein